MTTAPFEHRPGARVPAAGTTAGEDTTAADAGVGGPAEDAGEFPQQPPGYPEEVDPAEGPLAGREPGLLGDLRDPGAPPHDA
ncbi:hypothetical protein [Kineococcus glutinatus]|uniref:Uncharacterized protein n=1 Tax=Kineococcus glutinatus TaxID=1070872 RepID=A0ABP9HFY1_9ACTN